MKPHKKHLTILDFPKGLEIDFKSFKENLGYPAYRLKPWLKDFKESQRSLSLKVNPSGRVYYCLSIKRKMYSFWVEEIEEAVKTGGLKCNRLNKKMKKIITNDKPKSEIFEYNNLLEEARDTIVEIKKENKILKESNTILIKEQAGNSHTKQRNLYLEAEVRRLSKIKNKGLFKKVRKKLAKLISKLGQNLFKLGKNLSE